jgi:hypothetical protein
MELLIRKRLLSRAMFFSFPVTSVDVDKTCCNESCAEVSFVKTKDDKEVDDLFDDDGDAIIGELNSRSFNATERRGNRPLHYLLVQKSSS